MSAAVIQFSTRRQQLIQLADPLRRQDDDEGPVESVLDPADPVRPQLPKELSRVHDARQLEGGGRSGKRSEAMGSRMLVRPLGAVVRQPEHCADVVRETLQAVDARLDVAVPMRLESCDRAFRGTRARARADAGRTRPVVASRCGVCAGRSRSAAGRRSARPPRTRIASSPRCSIHVSTLAQQASAGRLRPD